MQPLREADLSLTKEQRIAKAKQQALANVASSLSAVAGGAEVAAKLLAGSSSMSSFVSQPAEADVAAAVAAGLRGSASTPFLTAPPDFYGDALGHSALSASASDVALSLAASSSSASLFAAAGAVVAPGSKDVSPMSSAVLTNVAGAVKGYSDRLVRLTHAQSEELLQRSGRAVQAAIDTALKDYRDGLTCVMDLARDHIAWLRRQHRHENEVLRGSVALQIEDMQRTVKVEVATAMAQLGDRHAAEMAAMRGEYEEKLNAATLAYRGTAAQVRRLVQANDRLLQAVLAIGEGIGLNTRISMLHEESLPVTLVHGLSVGATGAGSSGVRADVDIMSQALDAGLSDGSIGRGGAASALGAGRPSTASHASAGAAVGSDGDGAGGRAPSAAGPGKARGSVLSLAGKKMPSTPAAKAGERPPSPHGGTTPSHDEGAADRDGDATSRGPARSAAVAAALLAADSVTAIVHAPGTLTHQLLRVSALPDAEEERERLVAMVVARVRALQGAEADVSSLRDMVSAAESRAENWEAQAKESRYMLLLKDGEAKDAAEENRTLSKRVGELEAENKRLKEDLQATAGRLKDSEAQAKELQRSERKAVERLEKAQLEADTAKAELERVKKAAAESAAALAEVRKEVDGARKDAEAARKEAAKAKTDAAASIKAAEAKAAVEAARLQREKALAQQRADLAAAALRLPSLLQLLVPGLGMRAGGAAGPAPGGSAGAPAAGVPAAGSGKPAGTPAPSPVPAAAARPPVRGSVPAAAGAGQLVFANPQAAGQLVVELLASQREVFGRRRRAASPTAALEKLAFGGVGPRLLPASRTIPWGRGAPGAAPTSAATGAGAGAATVRPAGAAAATGGKAAAAAAPAPGKPAPAAAAAAKPGDLPAASPIALARLDASEEEAVATHQSAAAAASAASKPGAPGAAAGGKGKASGGSSPVPASPVPTAPVAASADAGGADTSASSSPAALLAALTAIEASLGESSTAQLTRTRIALDFRKRQQAGAAARVAEAQAALVRAEVERQAAVEKQEAAERARDALAAELAGLKEAEAKRREEDLKSLRDATAERDALRVKLRDAEAVVAGLRKETEASEGKVKAAEARLAALTAEAAESTAAITKARETARKAAAELKQEQERNKGRVEFPTSVDGWAAFVLKASQSFMRCVQHPGARGIALPALREDAAEEGGAVAGLEVGAGSPGLAARSRRQLSGSVSPAPMPAAGSESPRERAGSGALTDRSGSTAGVKLVRHRSSSRMSVSDAGGAWSIQAETTTQLRHVLGDMAQLLYGTSNLGAAGDSAAGAGAMTSPRGLSHSPTLRRVGSNATLMSALAAAAPQAEAPRAAAASPPPPSPSGKKVKHKMSVSMALPVTEFGGLPGSPLALMPAGFLRRSSGMGAGAADAAAAAVAAASPSQSRHSGQRRGSQPDAVAPVNSLDGVAAWGGSPDTARGGDGPMAIEGMAAGSAAGAGQHIRPRTSGSGGVGGRVMTATSRPRRDSVPLLSTAALERAAAGLQLPGDAEAQAQAASAAAAAAGEAHRLHALPAGAAGERRASTAGAIDKLTLKVAADGRSIKLRGRQNRAEAPSTADGAGQADAEGRRLLKPASLSSRGFIVVRTGPDAAREGGGFGGDGHRPAVRLTPGLHTMGLQWTHPLLSAAALTGLDAGMQMAAAAGQRAGAGAGLHLQQHLFLLSQFTSPLLSRAEQAARQAQRRTADQSAVPFVAPFLRRRASAPCLLEAATVARLQAASSGSAGLLATARASPRGRQLAGVAVVNLALTEPDAPAPGSPVGGVGSGFVSPRKAAATAAQARATAAASLFPTLPPSVAAAIAAAATAQYLLVHQAGSTSALLKHAARVAPPAVPPRGRAGEGPASASRLPAPLLAALEQATAFALALQLRQQNAQLRGATLASDLSLLRSMVGGGRVGAVGPGSPLAGDGSHGFMGAASGWLSARGGPAPMASGAGDAARYAHMFPGQSTAGYLYLPNAAASAGQAQQHHHHFPKTQRRQAREAVTAAFVAGVEQQLEEHYRPVHTEDSDAGASHAEEAADTLGAFPPHAEQYARIRPPVGFPSFGSLTHGHGAAALRGDTASAGGAVGPAASYDYAMPSGRMSAASDAASATGYSVDAWGGGSTADLRSSAPGDGGSEADPFAAGGAAGGRGRGRAAGSRTVNRLIQALAAGLTPEAAAAAASAAAGAEMAASWHVPSHAPAGATFGPHLDAEAVAAAAGYSQRPRPTLRIEQQAQQHGATPSRVAETTDHSPTAAPHPALAGGRRGSTSAGSPVATQFRSTAEAQGFVPSGAQPLRPTSVRFGAAQAAESAGADAFDSELRGAWQGYVLPANSPFVMLPGSHSQLQLQAATAILAQHGLVPTPFGVVPSPDGSPHKWVDPQMLHTTGSLHHGSALGHSHMLQHPGGVSGLGGRTGSPGRGKRLPPLEGGGAAAVAQPTRGRSLRRARSLSPPQGPHHAQPARLGLSPLRQGLAAGLAAAAGPGVTFTPLPGALHGTALAPPAGYPGHAEAAGTRRGSVASGQVLGGSAIGGVSMPAAAEAGDGRNTDHTRATDVSMWPLGYQPMAVKSRPDAHVYNQLLELRTHGRAKPAGFPYPVGAFPRRDSKAAARSVSGSRSVSREPAPRRSAAGEHGAYALSALGTQPFAPSFGVGDGDGGGSGSPAREVNDPYAARRPKSTGSTAAASGWAHHREASPDEHTHDSEMPASPSRHSSLRAGLQGTALPLRHSPTAADQLLRQGSSLSLGVKDAEPAAVADGHASARTDGSGRVGSRHGRGGISSPRGVAAPAASAPPSPVSALRIGAGAGAGRVARRSRGGGGAVGNAASEGDGSISADSSSVYEHALHGPQATARTDRSSSFAGGPEPASPALGIPGSARAWNVTAASRPGAGDGGSATGGGGGAGVREASAAADAMLSHARGGSGHDLGTPARSRNAAGRTSFLGANESPLSGLHEEHTAEDEGSTAPTP